MTTNIPMWPYPDLNSSRGWICPSCNAVYAPMCMQCFNCRGALTPQYDRKDQDNEHKAT